MTKRVAGIGVGKQAVAVSVARWPVRSFPNTEVGIIVGLGARASCEARGV